jgi:hypothetical protein
VLRLGLHGLRRGKARLFHEAASAVNLRAQVGIDLVAPVRIGQPPRQLGQINQHGQKAGLANFLRRVLVHFRKQPASHQPARQLRRFALHTLPESACSFRLPRLCVNTSFPFPRRMIPAAQCTRAPLKPLPRRTGASERFSSQFAALLVAAGLREPWDRKGHGHGRGGRRTGSELSFHSLRHTAVSLLKDAGIPDAVVQALVGHESAAMSQRYTHVGKEALAKAAAALPEL